MRVCARHVHVARCGVLRCECARHACAQVSTAVKAGYSQEDAATQVASAQVLQMGVVLLLGPPAGGVVADAVGCPWAFTLGGLTFFGLETAALIALACVRARERPAHEPAANGAKQPPPPQQHRGEQATALW